MWRVTPGSRVQYNSNKFNLLRLVLQEPKIGIVICSVELDSTLVNIFLPKKDV